MTEGEGRRFICHPDFPRVISLWPHIIEYQALAAKHGVFDIFQDNGGKLVYVLLLLGIKVLSGREGNDAEDEYGNQFELKTLNLVDTRGRYKRSLSFTTHHHLNSGIIQKYRKAVWIFCVFDGLAVKEIYMLGLGAMDYFYDIWEKKLESQDSINNPKVPLSFVREKGELIFQGNESGLDLF
jgi:hypothetical protein